MSKLTVVFRQSCVGILSSAVFFGVGAFSQSSSSSRDQAARSSALRLPDPPTPAEVASTAVSNPKQIASNQVRPFSRIGFGVKVGLLGAGFEVATPIARTLNLRGGADFFNYGRSFSVDNVNYNAKFNVRAAEASLDFFPWAKGFHLSPGAVVYNGVSLNADANVPPGSDFTLNGHDYVSGSTNPVTGTADVTLNRFAPKFTFGFGNLVPRNGRHFSIPFELGVAYIGDPKVKLNLAGTACADTYPPSNCQDVTTSQQIQADIAAEETKLEKDASAIKLMPVFSIGIAFNRGIGGR